MTNIEESFSNVMAELENEMNSMQEKMKVIMQESFQKLFQNIPELYAMSWEQYTPYFNDGDECVFSVREPRFIATPELDPNLWENENDLDTALDNADYEYSSFTKPWCYDNPEYNTRDYYKEDIETYNNMVEKLGEERLNEINGALGLFYSLMQKCEDAMRSAYGNHVKVTISRDLENVNELNVQVEDYDHD